MPKKNRPAPGRLWLSPAASIPSEVQQEPSYKPGLPTLSLNVEYTGPKPCIRVEAEGFEQGKSRAKSQKVQALELPLSGDLAFGFGESKNSEGKLLVAIIEQFSGGLIEKRWKSVEGMGIPPIGDRKWEVYEPSWPLEIADGSEAVVWGVFVGEPPESKEDMPIEDRVRHAEAAWLFKVSTSEVPKK